MAMPVSPAFLEQELPKVAADIVKGAWPCAICGFKWASHTHGRCSKGKQRFRLHAVFNSWPDDELFQACIEEVLRRAVIDNTGLSTHEIFYFQVCKNCNCYWQEHDHATGNCMFVPGGKYEIPDQFRPEGITQEQVRKALRLYR